MRYIVIPVFGALLFILPAFAHAATGVEVLMTDGDGKAITNFHPFGENYLGSGSIAAADLGEDDVEEIIVGSGPGLSPLVKIYRQDGSEISEFLAYAETYQNGITIAACDLDGNGTNEIVTGTMLGGGPHVRIFTADGKILYGGGFFAYDGAFRGGVNVACGDVDGDGFDDIVTGPGLTGGPHIKVFDPMGNLKYETFSGSALENTGASVAVGDVDGNGDMEIITGRMGAGDSTVVLLDERAEQLFFVLSVHAFEENKNGIQVMSGDVDGDGEDEIGVATNRDATGRIKFLELTGAVAEELTPFDTEDEKGIVATTLRDQNLDRVVSMSATPRDGDEVGKYIRVDISEQKLYAYENGVLANSFLVSTGVYQFPTPLGKTEVTAKLPVHDYVWSYGPDNPLNYNLPGVLWNLRFRRHFYIHSAYWHNNFGHRMSHGCVNVSIENAKWVYDWAEVGTSVEITE